MDANHDFNNAKQPKNWGANRNDPWKDDLNSSASSFGDALINVPLDEQPPEEAWLFDQWLMLEIGRAHVWTPVTDQSRMPSSAWKKKKTKKIIKKNVSKYNKLPLNTTELRAYTNH